MSWRVKLDETGKQVWEVTFLIHKVILDSFLGRSNVHYITGQTVTRAPSVALFAQYEIS